MIICSSFMISGDKEGLSDYLLNATLWFQTSPEMHAIYSQSFNQARQLLDMNITSATSAKKKAVITDIDESVLDNSPFEAKLIKSGITYNPQTWKQWTDLAIAHGLPGAAAFTRYAGSRNVEVFYVSNRKTDEFESTLKNLKNESFAFADPDHLILRKDEASKQKRFASISANYNVLLYVGDNINDFPEESTVQVFQNMKNSDKEFQEKDFNMHCIILPNPMYGSWENAVLGNDVLSDSEKLSRKKDALRDF